VVLLALLEVVTPREAFAGFSNDGMLTVAALFVVAVGLTVTGVMGYVGDRVLGRAKGERQASARLTMLLIRLSAFLNNTPIVAMMLPVAIARCRGHSISPSQLLMPVSFLTILGGTCSLIGASSNLVVHGLMEEADLRPLEMLEFGYAGLPGAIRRGSPWRCSRG
jgi:Na+/H+ antiporter NhaD/arsenite permease-like protein